MSDPISNLRLIRGGEVGTPELQAALNALIEYVGRGGGLPVEDGAPIADIRGGKITLNGKNPTPVAFGVDTAATMLGTLPEPFALENGFTLLVAPTTTASDNTVTFLATAGTSVSGADPSTDITADTGTKFLISVDGGEAKEVTLSKTDNDTGAEIAAELETKIQALGDEFAAVTAAYGNSLYTITSGTAGTASKVVITAATTDDVSAALKLGVENDGVETKGTGDAADIAKATAAEVAAAINGEGRATGWSASAEGGKVRVTSDTEGRTSALKVNASSTADDILGLSGAAYGAQGLGYDTEMADNKYLASATLNGVAQGSIAANGLSITNRTAAGFNVECETAAATAAVDLIIAGVADKLTT